MQPFILERPASGDVHERLPWAAYRHPVQEPAPGLYEALITEGLKAALDDLDARLLPRSRPLRSAEAPNRIAWHLGRQIELALSDLSESERVETGIRIARELLERLAAVVVVDRT